MRILVDCHAFDGGGQGVVSHIWGLYGALTRLQPQTEFFFAAHDVNNLKKFFDRSPNVRFVKYVSKNKYIRLLFEITWLQLKWKIDVLHCQYYLPLLRASREIVTIHDVLFLDHTELFPLGYRLKNGLLFAMATARADLVLTVSAYSKSRMQKHFGWLRRQVVVVPNGVMEFPKEQEPPKICLRQAKYILYVSRIEKRKNHVNLCRAFIQARLSDEYGLVLVGKDDVGSDEFHAFFRNLSEKHRRRVEILQSVSYFELADLYKKCSLFVFPSLCEGFGMPPLEAVLLGASVICAKNTAMSEFSFFEDRFFDATSVSEMSTKIEMYVDNRVNTESMKQAVVGKYSWDRIAQNYSTVLAERFIEV